MGILTEIAAKYSRVAFARLAGIEPDDWQQRALTSEAPRVLLNISRQCGKSTTCGILAAHQAIYRPGSLILCVAPSQRQSGELFRKVLAVYRALGRPVPASSESVLSLELENGSRVLALPGKEGSIRSFSGVNLLLLDEAARIPDDLLAAVRPMLAVSNGRLIALSTPWGKRGWFYTAWSGQEAWERYRVQASECPRISPAFLEEERRALGPLLFSVEYECEFSDPSGSLFRKEDVMAAIGEHDAWNFDRFLMPQASQSVLSLEMENGSRVLALGSQALPKQVS